MSEQLFIRVRGRIQGPFTPDQLQSLAKRGQFSRTAEISADGTTWVRAATRPELFAAERAEAIASAFISSDDLEPAPPPPPPVNSAPPPTDVWYYHQLGVNHGPIAFDHLQYLASLGQLTLEDVVWREGLPEWLPAGRVPGLFKSPAGLATPNGAVYVGVGQVQPSHSGSTEVPHMSGLAIASLVLGILPLCGIGSILAIIFGSVSMNQIKASRGKLTGNSLAIAGLVLGIIQLVLLIGYLVSMMLIPFL